MNALLFKFQESNTPLTDVSQKFEPAKRLHYSWEYRLFFNKSEVLRLPACTVFRISNSTSHYKLGITLKVRGRSIDRNRVKRRIREAFRRNESLLGSYDYNVVVSGRRSLEHPLPHQVADSLSKAFARPSLKFVEVKGS